MNSTIDEAPDVGAMLVFARAIALGGFAAAAREFGLTRAAVSRRIAGLERRLGTRLVHRTTRSLTLTEAGEVFYRYCQDVVQSAYAAETAARGFAEAPRGRLRISATPSVGRVVLAPALPDFLDRYPDIAVDLDLSAEHVDLVAHRIDIALRLTDAPPEQLHAVRLVANRYVLCAAPAYLERSGAVAVPGDLEGRAAIAFDPSGAPLRLRLLPIAGVGAEPYEWQTAARFAVNDIGALRYAAVAGLGITALPSYLFRREAAAGRLVQLLPGFRLETGYGQTVYALTLPGPRLAPKVRVFLDYLRGLPAFAPDSQDF